MPRGSYKDGIDYWNIDTDLFENKKIRLVRAEFGIKGVYLYLLILNEIYRGKGYYMTWDDDACLLMSDSSGVSGECSPTFISEAVRGLARRSLFDEGVLGRFGVLTSAEIQRRFLRIVGNSRDNIPMIEEYFLLDPSNPKDVTRATLNKIAFFSVENKDSPQNLKDYVKNLKVLDKEKKRKEKQRKEENGTPAASAPATLEEIEEFGKSIGSPVDAREWFNYYAARGWMMGKSPMRDWKAAFQASENWEQWKRTKGGKVPSDGDYDDGKSFV